MMSFFLQKARDIFRPGRAQRLSALTFVSEDVRFVAKKLFDYISKCGKMSPEEFAEAKRLIEEFPNNEIFNVVHWNGYTLLQQCIYDDKLELAKVMIKKGCDVNSGICSLPLHLACALGNVDAVQLLLCYGAKPENECAVCFPDQHNLKTYPDQVQCLAYQNVVTALQYALMSDKEMVLKMLLHHENCKNSIRTEFLVHEACRMSAKQCLVFLMGYCPDQLTQMDKYGRTPVQICLVNGNTEEATAIAEKRTKAVSDDDFVLHEIGSTLHEFYNTIKKVSPGVIRGTTAFSCENGFRNHVNIRDSQGNTALFALLRNVGRTVYRSNRITIKPHGQQEYQMTHQAIYDREMLESITILMEKGASANVINYSGETALHSILVDTSNRQLHVQRHGQMRRLKSVLTEICKAVRILLNHGADTGHRICPAFVPFVQPIFYGVRIFETLRPETFVIVKDPLKELLRLLCQENCDMNVMDSYGCTPFLHILVATYRMISLYACDAFMRHILPFIGDIMCHYLSNGLNPNAQVMYSSRRMDDTYETSYFREIVLFLNFPANEMTSYYDNVAMLLACLMQRGGNPNLLTFAPLYGTRRGLTDEVPVDAPLSFLLVRSLYRQSENSIPHVLKTLELFESSLVQSKLNELTDAMNHYIQTDLKTSAASLSPRAAAYIDQITNSPRRLKTIARIAISENLEWKLGLSGRLPLPKQLLTFCYNLMC